MKEQEQIGKRNPVCISIEYDNGDIEECPIDEIDEEYRDQVIEDVEHYADVENNRRQLRALGFTA